MQSTFVNVGWDFVEEAVNGTDDVWKICDGTNTPKLSWQKPVVGDWDCPDGVFVEDLGVLADEWLLGFLTYDVAPDGPDGIVNWYDFAMLGVADEMGTFASEWLKPGAVRDDFAPNGA